jgi:hypothetical protein
MEPSQYSPLPPAFSGPGIGFASNGGTKRYLIEAESTTGFVAWRVGDGTTLINAAETVDLPAGPSVSFWPCAGYEDSTPAGEIISLDCHANQLTDLDVHALTSLRFLDCCYNQLTQLDLVGLNDLEVLDADNNQLNDLNVSANSALRILNCAHNRLTKLDLSGLSTLQILDCSGNPLVSIKAEGCSCLTEAKGAYSV